MTATETSFRVSLPDDLAAEYQSQAERQGQPLERVLSDRLERAAKFLDTKPIYITDEQRQVIERILGQNISTPQKLIAVIQNMAGVKVDEVFIELPTRLRSRIESRSFGLSFAEVLKREVIQGLERFAQLR